MLTADPKLQLRLGHPAFLTRDFYQPAYARDIDGLERILLEDLSADVFREEYAGVISAVAEGHLREVIGPEAEEVRDFGNITGGERRSGNFDHRPDGDRQLPGVLLLLLDHCNGFEDQLTKNLKLATRADQRHHDLWHRLDALLEALDRCFCDRSGLHFRDLRIGDREPATTMPEHRIHLMEHGHPTTDL